MTDFWANLPSRNLTSEAEVETVLLSPLLSALGYTLDDIAPQHPVVFQEGRRGRKHAADFVCFNGLSRERQHSLLVVEAKASSERLSSGKKQGESYARNLSAPMLLLTNGSEVEIWQHTRMQESVCSLKVSVASMKGERGKVESLISRQAIITYRRSLEDKLIQEVTTDFTNYRQAECQRTEKYANSISRALIQMDGSTPPLRHSSERLPVDFRKGAIVIAASGLGKTTLAARMFHDFVSVKKRPDEALLPFDVPLPDFAQTGNELPKFLYERLSAHQPAVTIASFQELLRDCGAVLICDGFDRVAMEQQASLNGQLVRLMRDFPKIQVFIFSRYVGSLSVDLPTLKLEGLSIQDFYAMERAVLSHKVSQHSIMHRLSSTLRNLCESPLIVNHLLGYFRTHDKPPSELLQIFEFWLSEVLSTKPTSLVASLEREKAMTVIANATLEAPLPTSKLLPLLLKHGLSPVLLDDLLYCAAIRKTGSVIEVEHDALADYLRAKDVVSTREGVSVEQLARLPIKEDCFFPVLMMALLPNRDFQSAWWARLATTNLSVYGDALRYRYDTSDELRNLPPEALSRQYLEELLAGIELPLNGLLPQLCEECTELLIGQATGPLAVTGKVGLHNGGVGYRLHSQEKHQPLVTVRDPEEEGRGYRLDYRLAQKRLDNGRILGAWLLQETLEKAIKYQRINAGSHWAAERLVGRLRYLVTRHQLPVDLDASLDKVEAALRPHSDESIPPESFRFEESFTIQSMLSDVTTLRTHGVTMMDPWWIRCGWNVQGFFQNDQAISQVLDEHYRRLQVVYAETVVQKFSKVSNQMRLFTILPVRWITTVVRMAPNQRGVGVYYHLRPVARWAEAGADVSFAESPPEQPDPQEFWRALNHLKRPARMAHNLFGWTNMPYFNGQRMTGGYDGATSVMNEVCKILKEEVRALFSSVPGQDH